MADYKPKMFFGTAQTVLSNTTDIAAGNFSPAGTDYNNTSDAAVPYAPYAVAMIECAFATAPTAGNVVELWGLMVDTDGADDDTDPPSGTAPGGARYLGSWVVAAVTGLQRREIVLNLNGLRQFTPYVKNSTGAVMNNDTTTLTVKITPYTIGVTA